MFTTSRYASEETKEFTKKMAKENNEYYIGRGKRTIAQLVEIARRKGEELIHIVEEMKKEPMVISTIAVTETGEWNWIKEKKIKKATESEL